MNRIDQVDGNNMQNLPLYPNARGVYILTDEDGYVLYIGRSKQLCRRASHLTAMQRDSTNPQGLSHIKAGLVRKLQEQGKTIRISCIQTENDKAKEADLIRKYRPPWNKAGVSQPKRLRSRLSGKV